MKSMSLKLPNPRGKYAVGCIDVLPNKGPEAIFLRLYYPTSEFSPLDKNLAFWAKESEYVYGYSRFLDLSWLNRALNWFIGNQKIPVRWEGPLISDKNDIAFPIVVFSHGLGGNRTSNSYLCYELASHGFIVAAVEHKDLSASTTYFLESQGQPGGTEKKKEWVYMLKVDGDDPSTPLLRNMQVTKRAHECSKCLDILEELNSGTLQNIISNFDLSSFKARLNMSQVAAVGHSFGGTTSIVNLNRDRRFKVAAMLDAWMAPIDITLWNSIYDKKFSEPMLFLNSEKFQSAHSVECIKRIRTNEPGLKKEFKMAGLVHQSFSDFSLIMPYWLAKLFGVSGVTDSVLAAQVTADAVLRFVGNEFDLDCKGNVDLLVDECEFFFRENC